MKRLYRPIEKDEICYEIDRCEREIATLKAKMQNDGISEWEFATLQMWQNKLKYLKRS